MEGRWALQDLSHEVAFLPPVGRLGSDRPDCIVRTAEDNDHVGQEGTGLEEGIGPEGTGPEVDTGPEEGTGLEVDTGLEDTVDNSCCSSAECTLLLPDPQSRILVARGSLY